MSVPKIKKDLSVRVATSRTFSNLTWRFQLDTKAVLDVGCSEGHHLMYFGSGSVGVTIIREHVESAARQGLSVVLGNVEDADFSLPEKFDVVWANNLFEHMNAPHLFLMKMREFLKPGGVLILGVPVLPTGVFLTRFSKFRGAYAVSHVNFFTRKTLIETVRAGGWVAQEARPFFFKNAFLDSLVSGLAPHVYVVAGPMPGFTYPRKREMSLRGYADTMKETFTP